MFADFGYGVMILTFALALYSIGAAVLGHVRKSQKLVESARLAMLLTFPMITLGALSLIYLLVTDQYSVSFVYQVASSTMPFYLKITALWGGQAGSLVLWSWLMSTFAAAVTLRKWDRDREFLPWVIVVCSLTLAFFVGLVVFFENPFARYWQTMSGEVVTAMFQPASSTLFTPQDGNGLNPLLRHPGMIIHPPMLYLGFVSFVIPFAFAIAALVTGRTDDRWIRLTRRWTLVAWLFLSCGLVLGSRWAYDVLGWGGFWGWDAVEVAAFMPWLAGTAFLHSVMIQEKRGMLKKWNLALILGAWLLSIFGTFITRSGVIASVHSFTQSNVGYFFLGFLLVAAIATTTLYVNRLPQLTAEATLESIVSREASFLFNNLLLIGIAFSVLWGTLFPILSEAIRGTKITVGPPFFNQVNIPLGLALLAMTGIGPLIAWRRASLPNLRRQFAVPLTSCVFVLLMLLVAGMRDIGALIAFSIGAFVLATVTQEFTRGARARHRQYGEPVIVALFQLLSRNRRRYGGYIVHVAMVLLFVAFAGMAFKTETQATLRPGETATLQGPDGHVYTFTHLGISQYNALNRQITAALLDVRRDGKAVGHLRTEKRQHVDALGNPTFEPSTEVGIMSGLRVDLYVVLAGLVNGTEQAVFRFTINPLVWWVWFGGFVLVLGGLIVLWPGGGAVAVRGSSASRVQAGYAVKLEAER